MLAEDIRGAVQANQKSGPSSSSTAPSANNVVDEIVASLSNDPTIQSAYRDEVKGSVNQRLKNDKDFEPEKYPNSSKYFK